MFRRISIETVHSRVRPCTFLFCTLSCRSLLEGARCARVVEIGFKFNHFYEEFHEISIELRPFLLQKFGEHFTINLCNPRRPVKF